MSSILESLSLPMELLSSIYKVIKIILVHNVGFDSKSEVEFLPQNALSRNEPFIQAITQFLNAMYHSTATLRSSHIVERLRLQAALAAFGGSSSVPNILSQNRLVTPNPFS